MHTLHRRGISLIEVVVVITIITLLIALLLPAIQQARGSARRLQCENNLRQIGLGIENYTSNFGWYPSLTSNGYSLYVQILPYVGQQALYDRIDFREHGGMSVVPRSNNYVIDRTRVPIFFCPDAIVHPQIKHTYRFCTGEGLVVAGSDNGALTVGGKDPVSSSERRSKPAYVEDGTSHTVFAAELSPPPEPVANMRRPTHAMYDVLYDHETEVVGLYMNRCRSAFQSGLPPQDISMAGSYLIDSHNGTTIYNHVFTPGEGNCRGITKDYNGGRNTGHTADSDHAGGIVNLLYADGHVESVARGVDLTVWRALASRSGGD